MQELPILLPTPRYFKYFGGFCNITDLCTIHLDHPAPDLLLFMALRLQTACLDQLHVKLDISANKYSGANQDGITLRLNSQAVSWPQGYQLKISPESILIEARDESGLFYGCCTLIQIIQFYTWNTGMEDLPAIESLPCLEIQDWPDFQNRGVMLDISRNKVPTMETLFELVDLLASWKINQLQLYTEHTFAYHQHPEVWADASPFTGEEILKLGAFCRERYVELVPNQNSFGHLERWLRLPRYRELAEVPDGFEFPWGHHDGPFSLCPTDPQSIFFLESLYDELLPNYTSRQFNVGCDETHDLGQGRSKEACERLGAGQVYLDFLNKIHHNVTKRGFRMQFWADMIILYPQLIKKLPPNAIALEWGYERDHPFRKHAALLSEQGVTFYVCPGTSSWNSIAGRTDNCLQNLSSAARSGLEYGAAGYLITDWGDNGHWQASLISYLGLAAGAAYSWAYQVNLDQLMDIPAVLNHYAFYDPSGYSGQLAYTLGNIYHEAGIEPDNSSAFFEILQSPIDHWKGWLEGDRVVQTFTHTLDILDQLDRNISKISSTRSDKDLLQREFILTINLLRHACKRGIFGYNPQSYQKRDLANDLEGIIAEYQRLWLSRNRPGGLKDSLAFFETARNEYR